MLLSLNANYAVTTHPSKQRLTKTMPARMPWSICYQTVVARSFEGKVLETQCSANGSIRGKIVFERQCSSKDGVRKSVF